MYQVEMLMCCQGTDQCLSSSRVARVLFSFYWRRYQFAAQGSYDILGHDQEFSFLFMDGVPIWTSLLPWLQGTRVLFSFYGWCYQPGISIVMTARHIGFPYIENTMAWNTMYVYTLNQQRTP